MDYNYTNLDEFLKDFYNKKLGFPYLNQKFNKNQILNVFNNIKKFNHQKYLQKKNILLKVLNYQIIFFIFLVIHIYLTLQKLIIIKMIL
jgi:hypothetical protein